MGAPVQMDVLAGQRGTPAGGTAMPVGLQGADTATQKNALELLHVAGGGSHDLKDSPSRARLLPVCDGQAAGKTDCGYDQDRAPSGHPRRAAIPASRRGARIDAIDFHFPELAAIADVDSLVMIATSDRQQSLHRRAPGQSPSREGGA
jgi:hypothetical protein